MSAASTTPDDRALERARELLARPGAWLEPAPGGYHLRTAPDRRRRPALLLDEPTLRELVDAPGLRPRDGGGWTARPAAPAAPAPAPGRPGTIAGERLVTEPGGAVALRAANLGESPLGWLLRRGALTPVQAAAGERLREDVHRAGVIGRLTMSWDAGPRASGGRGPGEEPAERARAAKARVAAALDAAGPGLREVLEAVCVRGGSLEAVERGLDLPRRSGKAVLRLALDRLASHYRIG